MSKTGIVTNVSWLVSQVGLLVEYGPADKIVVVQTAEQFINAFGFNLLTANDRIDLSKLVGMWVDTEIDESDMTFVTKSYQKTLMLNDQLASLSFGIQSNMTENGFPVDEQGEQQVLPL